MNTSVWDQIEPDAAKAKVLKARSFLMMQVSDQVESWGITQKEAGKRLGVTRERVSDLLRGEFGKFNFEALHELAIKAGIELTFEAEKKARRTAPAVHVAVKLPTKRRTTQPPKQLEAAHG